MIEFITLVRVSMDVEFAGVNLLEARSTRFDVGLLALPTHRMLSIKDSFKIVSKRDASTDGTNTEIRSDPKSSVHHHCVHTYLFLFIFIVYAVVN
eukprot:TRINITY_DN881_c0_g1_i5.p1 TRINITY_DN881_c0_g1~~TRINITY_DN881_c0_g1_i5.p1  ORF type:complete len:95 (-),score=9.04 TRINITY_DN881_c0_g1_i5:85-369(-)